MFPLYILPFILSSFEMSVCIDQFLNNALNLQGAVHEFRLPLPMVTIVQSGKVAPGKVNCIKEYMVVPGTELAPEKVR